MSPDEMDTPIAGCGVDAAPYVLGSLTDVEVETFTAHLASCAVCREEVAALQVVAAALPAAVPQIKAPSELRQRVLTTVEQEARMRAPAVSGARADRPAARARFGWRPALAGAGLVAGVAAALAIAFAPSGGAGSARTIQAEVLAPRASATLRVSENHAELNIAGMPQTTPGRVYEVWIQRAGSPQPTNALFTVSRAGDATVGVPGAIAGVKVVMVTSEPRDGSTVPTRSPVIVARVS